MSLSIAYDARAGVGKARDNDIIEFSDGFIQDWDDGAILRTMITFRKNILLHRG